MSIRRTATAVLAVLVLLAWVPAAAAAAAPGRPSAPPGQVAEHAARHRAPGEVDPSTVLVRFADPRAAQAVAAAHGVRADKPVGATGYVRVSTAGRAPIEVRDRLRADRRVAAAELNYRRRAFATPDDTHYGTHQGYLGGLRFPEAWDRVKAPRSQVVAVVDSGVDLDHPDLAPQVVAGWDFVGDGIVEDGTPQDENGHGTLVAGVAAGATNNGRGTAGAAWNASIMPLRVLDGSGGGWDDDVAAAITWAADHGATVINLSLGGPDESDMLEAAIDYALSRNAVVVAAAGNEGIDRPMFPAAYPAVLAVGAVDGNRATTKFSQRGPWVDLAATGFDVAGPELAAGPAEAYTDGGDGTSFAAPLVAGAAALVRAQNPTWPEAQVVDRLQRTARDAGPAGVDDFYGFGVLDAAAAVGASASAALAPRAGDGAEPNGHPLRAAPIGSSATASIAPEGDVDWFAYEVTTPGWLTFTMTPNARGDALVLDGVLVAFGPDGTGIGFMDETFSDEPELLTVEAPAAGRYLVRVSNYYSSVSPGTYTLSVAYSGSQPPTWDPVAATPFPTYWMADVTPPTGASGVAPGSTVRVRFGRDVAPASVTTATVQLVDGRTRQPVAAALAYDAATRTATLTPSAALLHSRPYHVRVTGVTDGVGTMAFEDVTYFVTAAPPPPPPPPPRSGYWMVDSAGFVYRFGDAQWYGALNGARRDVVDIEPAPNGNGYWLVTASGHVFAYGSAGHKGDGGWLAPGETVTSMSANPVGAGYWLFTTRGRVMAIGGAPFLGDMSGAALNGPVLDSVATPSGRGYYLVASDGGMFAFGDAQFRGSMGGQPLNKPVQSLVPDGDNDGYWLVASDGGVFAFSAPFRGSMGSVPLNRPVTGMVRYGNGYLMVGEDGGIFSFSDKPYAGSLATNPPPDPVVAVAALNS